MSMNLSGHYAYVIAAASGQGGEFSASGADLSIFKTAEVSGIYSNLAMFVVYGSGTITIECSSWVRCLACVCVDAG